MIYLAGPMSNISEHNYPAFTEACRALRAAGHVVVSPHEETPCEDHAHPQPWTYYLRRDLRTLLGCDGIALLPGWSLSKGVQLELQVAMALDFVVYDVINGRLVPHEQS